VICVATVISVCIGMLAVSGHAVRLGIGNSLIGHVFWILRPAEMMFCQ